MRNPRASYSSKGSARVSRIFMGQRSYPGGTFYDSYADALTLLGSTQVLRASLVLDSGWQNAPLGDQVLTPTNITVNGDTFVPASGGAQTCDLPPATIQISKTAGVETGDVNADNLSISMRKWTILDKKKKKGNMLRQLT